MDITILTGGSKNEFRIILELLKPSYDTSACYLENTKADITFT